MAVIKFGGLAPNDVLNGFKIGDMILYRHIGTCMHAVRKLAVFSNNTIIVLMDGGHTQNVIYIVEGLFAQVVLVKLHNTHTKIP